MPQQQEAAKVGSDHQGVLPVDTHEVDRVDRIPATRTLWTHVQDDPFAAAIAPNDDGSRDALES